MKTLEFIALAALVTASMATVDFCYARNNAALEHARTEGRIPGAPWWRQWNHVAARWSVMQWMAVIGGFYLSVKVTMQFLPFEGLGLYIGMAIGARDRRTRSSSSPVTKTCPGISTRRGSPADTVSAKSTPCGSAASPACSTRVISPSTAGFARDR